jgi:ABC-type molybdate transport system substrate-binding protein
LRTYWEDTVKQQTKILLGIAALAVVATAVVLMLTRSTSDSGRPSASAEPSGNQAHQVAEALGRLTTDPDSLVATGSREQVGQRAREGVPAGSTIEVDEASWAPDGVGGGTISATLRSPGQPPVTYAVVMVSESGKWKVAATIPLAEPTR